MPPPSRPSDPFLPSTDQTNKDASDLERKKAQRKKLDEQQPKDQGKDSEKQAKDKATAAPKNEPIKDEIVEPEPQEVLEAIEPKADETAQAKNQDKSAQSDNAPGRDESPLGNKELDMVLSIPTPNELKGTDKEGHQHPHLEASPYEHHFDTYTLVQELCKEVPNPEDPEAPPDSAFSDKQAITLMKAIRLMLAQNLELAKEGLVSKSDTENETYLFRAACSELKTTMQTGRFMEAQKQRSQRAQLQHEHDILNQKVTQDIMTMREELKGMFNDRKLGLQEEKRQVDGKIQGLSYRISVDLNSEAKSEVEGLRWVLTRRAALAILSAAFMVLSSLQYYSVSSREAAEVEKKRKAAQTAQDERMRKEQERFGSSGATVGRSTGTQTDGIVLGGTAGTGSYEESLG